MKLIQHYHCILASAAMALEQTPEKLIEMLGHDGMEVIEPSLPEPGCYKGYHPQEIIEVILRHAKTATLIEARPAQTPDGEHVFELKTIGSFGDPIIRFQFYLNHRRGILLGRTEKWHHACSFEYGRIHDPRGMSYGLDDCKIQVESLLIVE